MGYQPLDPKSAIAMKRTAEGYRKLLSKSRIDDILKEIKDNALYGSMCLTYKHDISKDDISELKSLGYRVTKNWFKVGYTIWWCDD